jgi:hypothetical protein
MIRSLLKIVCLSFVCCITGYAVAMAQHEGFGNLTLPDYIGAAQAQDMQGTEPAPDGAYSSPLTKKGVNYITGGIGDEERKDFEARRKEYNLHLTLTSRHGAFAGDTGLSIERSSNTVLQEVDAGPLFYANLAPGSYSISLSHGGLKREMTVVIRPSKPLYLNLSL